MNHTLQKGYTLVELIVGGIMIAILVSLVTVNLVGANRSAVLSTSITALISDLKLMQIKSMDGDTEARGTISTYGMHFYNNSYVLFHGTYSVNDTTNITITLDPQLTFSTINLPSSEIKFANGDGAIVGFVQANSTLVLQDTSNSRQKTITVNKYGVITSVN